MKITIKREELLKGLNKSINAVNPRSTLPILANILLDAKKDGTISITGTDLELGIINAVSAVDVSEPGTITIPAKKFNDIIRELSGDTVEIAVTKNHSINIKCGKAFFRLVGLPKDDYPKFPEYSLDSGFEIDQQLLKECITLTAFAISADETRYVLNGALLCVNKKEMRVIATDGRRLAFVQKTDLPIDKTVNIEVIIPTKALTELSKNLGDSETVRIIHLGNSIVFNIKETTIISRLIEGHFPNYEQVIPSETTIKTRINREMLLSTIKRVSLLTSLDAQAIKVDLLKSNKMILSARSPNLGESKEEIETLSMEGNEITIGFNPVYLLDALRHLDVQEIELCLINSEKPGVIQGKEGYVYVIMPMQIG